MNRTYKRVTKQEVNEDINEYNLTRDEYSRLRRRYTLHRWHAIHRGIDWLFTFRSWMDFWIVSGVLDQRGRGKDDYVMARFLDLGPYSPDNVRAITNWQNSVEGKNFPWMRD